MDLEGDRDGVGHRQREKEMRKGRREVVPWHAGSVMKATCHVIAAFLPLHEQAIQWPNSEEKCSASESDWVESISCHAWWPGFCMVDGMLIPLFSKPGHFGEQFFDHKSNYSLSLTVQVSSISWGLITNFFAACNIAKSPYHRLCAWTTGQHTWCNGFQGVTGLQGVRATCHKWWMTMGGLSICVIYILCCTI